VSWAGGSDIYRLNLQTLVWTKTTMPGAIPGPAYWEGTYGRFRYVPTLKSFVGVNSIDQNAYMFTKSSDPTPTPTPTPAPTPAIISLRTWKFLPYAPYSSLNTYGTSATLSRFDKHSILTSVNGITYITGGDYYGKSYRQETWALDIAARLANINAPTAGWTLAYPYCGVAGAVQPKGPDHVGWTYDAARKRIWMVPGEMQPHGTSYPLCSGETTGYVDDNGTAIGGPKLLYGHIMAFDYQRGLWEDFMDLKGLIDWKNSWWAVYDPQTDSIIKGINGQKVGILNIATKNWEFITPSGWPFSGGVWQKAHAAADIMGRRIFLVDADRGRLLKWNIDEKKMVDLGDVPPGGQINTDGTRGYTVWDSKAKILIVMHYDPSKGIYLYYPDEPTPRWEKVDFPTEGLNGPVQWRAATYDAVNNLIIGLGVADGGSSPGLWILRLTN